MGIAFQADASKLAVPSTFKIATAAAVTAAERFAE
jgi:hypothetical protein